jgi:hypothetical protein
LVDQIRIQAKAGDGRNGALIFAMKSLSREADKMGHWGEKAAASFWRTDVHTDDLLDFYF